MTNTNEANVLSQVLSVEEIEQFRKAIGMTITEYAQVLGYSESNVKHVIYGTRPVYKPFSAAVVELMQKCYDAYGSQSEFESHVSKMAYLKTALVEGTL
ncbi:Uncharacterised protein [Lysinibacillus sphaericus]|nr:Uncharacterised protein [Lysinibacillus sphaericus]